MLAGSAQGVCSAAHRKLCRKATQRTVKVSLNGRKIGLVGAICLGVGENSLALEEKSGQPADRDPCPNAPNFDQTPRNQPPCCRSFGGALHDPQCKRDPCQLPLGSGDDLAASAKLIWANGPYSLMSRAS